MSKHRCGVLILTVFQFFNEIQITIVALTLHQYNINVQANDSFLITVKYIVSDTEAFYTPE